MLSFGFYGFLNNMIYLTSLLTSQPLSVELGPGILGNIFDGIQVCDVSAPSISELQILPEQFFFLSFVGLLSVASFKRYLCLLTIHASFGLKFDAEASEDHCKTIWGCVYSSWCRGSCP